MMVELDFNLSFLLLPFNTVGIRYVPLLLQVPGKEHKDDKVLISYSLHFSGNSIQ